ncbi:MAG: hypothetical protein KBF73_08795 [Flavobacteriales bacterium]|nr:hypothetical protein [Flavobacteriales bacterium]
MKKIFFALLTVISFTAFAQQPILVTMDSIGSNDNLRNVFTVDIPQVSLKDVERDWLKTVGKRAQDKATVVNGENIQKGAVNKNISPEPFTLYSKLVETTAGVRLTVWLAQNNIVSASGMANANQDLAVQKFMRDFALSAYRGAVETELKTEESKLRDLEKDMSKAVKSEEKLNKDIKKNERSNEKDEEAIATTKRDIQRVIESITEQKNMVELTAADPNANKGAKKTLSKLEDKKKDLQKENEKKSKEIEERNKETRAASREKEAAHQLYEAKVAEVEAQREVVNTAKRKLDDITSKLK